MYRPTYVGGLVFDEDCMRALEIRCLRCRFNVFSCKNPFLKKEKNKLRMEAPTASPSAPEQVAFLLQKRSGLATDLQAEIGALQEKEQHLYSKSWRWK